MIELTTKEKKASLEYANQFRDGKRSTQFLSFALQVQDILTADIDDKTSLTNAQQMIVFVLNL